MTNALPLLPAGHFEHLPADHPYYQTTAGPEAILDATRAAMGPDPLVYFNYSDILRDIEPRNKPLVAQLLALLDAAARLAAGIADNALDTGGPIPAAAVAQARHDLGRVGISLATASKWVRSEALPATGHRLPTHLDASTALL